MPLKIGRPHVAADHVQPLHGTDQVAAAKQPRAQVGGVGRYRLQRVDHRVLHLAQQPAAGALQLAQPDMAERPAHAVHLGAAVTVGVPQQRVGAVAQGAVGIVITPDQLAAAAVGGEVHGARDVEVFALPVAVHVTHQREPGEVAGHARLALPVLGGEGDAMFQVGQRSHLEGERVAADSRAAGVDQFRFGAVTAGRQAVHVEHLSHLPVHQHPAVVQLGVGHARPLRVDLLRQLEQRRVAAGFVDARPHRAVGPRRMGEHHVEGDSPGTAPACLGRPRDGDPDDAQERLHRMRRQMGVLGNLFVGRGWQRSVHDASWSGKSLG